MATCCGKARQLCPGGLPADLASQPAGQWNNAVE
jgi:hypothetical protein